MLESEQHVARAHVEGSFPYRCRACGLAADGALDAHATATVTSTGGPGGAFGNHYGASMAADEANAAAWAAIVEAVSIIACPRCGKVDAEARSIVVRGAVRFALGWSLLALALGFLAGFLVTGARDLVTSGIVGFSSAVACGAVLAWLRISHRRRDAARVALTPRAAQ